MNTNIITQELRPPDRFPEFLEAVNRAYRRIGLSVDDARAAAFADAEIFLREPSTAGCAP